MGRHSALSDGGVEGDSRHRTAAVVLAAGTSTRFGGTKQLVEVAGRPLVAHAVAAAHGAGIDRVVVVVGHAAAAVAAAASEGGEVGIVVNERFGQGQATSLKAGVVAVAHDEAIQAIVVLLADQPGVAPETIRRVVAAVGAGAEVARAGYVDQPGHPVAFARAVFGRLERLTGDTGARQLFNELSVTDVPVSGAMPPDVDTSADLEQIRDSGFRHRRSTGPA